jgi:hypothetical protein
VSFSSSDDFIIDVESKQHNERLRQQLEQQIEQLNDNQLLIESHLQQEEDLAIELNDENDEDENDQLINSASFNSISNCNLNDEANLPTSSEQRIINDDYLITREQLEIELAGENSDKVIESIEKQSPIIERELMHTEQQLENLKSRLEMSETVTSVTQTMLDSIRKEYYTNSDEEHDAEKRQETRQEMLISSSNEESHRANEEIDSSENDNEPLMSDNELNELIMNINEEMRERVEQAEAQIKANLDAKVKDVIESFVKESRSELQKIVMVEDVDSNEELLAEEIDSDELKQEQTKPTDVLYSSTENEQRVEPEQEEEERAITKEEDDDDINVKFYANPAQRLSISQTKLIEHSDESDSNAELGGTTFQTHVQQEQEVTENVHHRFESEQEEVEMAEFEQEKLKDRPNMVLLNKSKQYQTFESSSSTNSELNQQEDFSVRRRRDPKGKLDDEYDNDELNESVEHVQEEQVLVEKQLVEEKKPKKSDSSEPLISVTNSNLIDEDEDAKVFEEEQQSSESIREIEEKLSQQIESSLAQPGVSLLELAQNNCVSQSKECLISRDLSDADLNAEWVRADTVVVDEFAKSEEQEMAENSTTSFSIPLETSKQAQSPTNESLTCFDDVSITTVIERKLSEIDQQHSIDDANSESGRNAPTPTSELKQSSIDYSSSEGEAFVEMDEKNEEKTDESKQSVEEAQSKVLISIESVKLLTSSGSEGEDLVLINEIQQHQQQQDGEPNAQSGNLLDLDATLVHLSESTEPLLSRVLDSSVLAEPNDEVPMFQDSSCSNLSCATSEDNLLSNNNNNNNMIENNYALEGSLSTDGINSVANSVGSISLNENEIESVTSASGSISRSLNFLSSLVVRTSSNEKVSATNMKDIEHNVLNIFQLEHPQIDALQMKTSSSIELSSMGNKRPNEFDLSLSEHVRSFDKELQTPTPTVENSKVGDFFDRRITSSNEPSMEPVAVVEQDYEYDNKEDMVDMPSEESFADEAEEGVEEGPRIEQQHQEQIEVPEENSRTTTMVDEEVVAAFATARLFGETIYSQSSDEIKSQTQEEEMKKTDSEASREESIIRSSLDEKQSETSFENILAPNVQADEELEDDDANKLIKVATPRAFTKYIVLSTSQAKSREEAFEQISSIKSVDELRRVESKSQSENDSEQSTTPSSSSSQQYRDRNEERGELIDDSDGGVVNLAFQDSQEEEKVTDSHESTNLSSSSSSSSSQESVRVNKDYDDSAEQQNLMNIQIIQSNLPSKSLLLPQEEEREESVEYEDEPHLSSGLPSDVSIDFERKHELIKQSFKKSLSHEEEEIESSHEEQDPATNENEKIVSKEETHEEQVESVIVSKHGMRLDDASFLVCTPSSSNQTPQHEKEIVNLLVNSQVEHKVSADESQEDKCEQETVESTDDHLEFAKSIVQKALDMSIELVAGNLSQAEQIVGFENQSEESAVIRRDQTEDSLSAQTHVQIDERKVLESEEKCEITESLELEHGSSTIADVNEAASVVDLEKCLKMSSKEVRFNLNQQDEQAQTVTEQTESARVLKSSQSEDEYELAQLQNENINEQEAELSAEFRETYLEEMKEEQQEQHIQEELDKIQSIILANNYEETYAKMNEHEQQASIDADQLSESIEESQVEQSVEIDQSQEVNASVDEDRELTSLEIHSQAREMVSNVMESALEHLRVEQSEQSEQSVEKDEKDDEEEKEEKKKRKRTCKEEADDEEKKHRKHDDDDEDDNDDEDDQNDQKPDNDSSRQRLILVESKSSTSQNSQNSDETREEEIETVPVDESQSVIFLSEQIVENEEHQTAHDDELITSSESLQAPNELEFVALNVSTNPLLTSSFISLNEDVHCHQQQQQTNQQDHHKPIGHDDELSTTSVSFQTCDETLNKQDEVEEEEEDDKLSNKTLDLDTANIDLNQSQLLNESDEANVQQQHEDFNENASTASYFTAISSVQHQTHSLGKQATETENKRHSLGTESTNYMTAVDDLTHGGSQFTKSDSFCSAVESLSTKTSASSNRHSNQSTYSCDVSTSSLNSSLSTLHNGNESVDMSDLNSTLLEYPSFEESLLHDESSLNTEVAKEAAELGQFNVQYFLKNMHPLVNASESQCDLNRLANKENSSHTSTLTLDEETQHQSETKPEERQEETQEEARKESSSNEVANEAATENNEGERDPNKNGSSSSSLNEENFELINVDNASNTSSVLEFEKLEMQCAISSSSSSDFCASSTDPTTTFIQQPQTRSFSHEDDYLSELGREEMPESNNKSFEIITYDLNTIYEIAESEENLSELSSKKPQAESQSVDEETGEEFLLIEKQQTNEHHANVPSIQIVEEISQQYSELVQSDVNAEENKGHGEVQQEIFIPLACSSSSASFDNEAEEKSAFQEKHISVEMMSLDLAEVHQSPISDHSNIQSDIRIESGAESVDFGKDLSHGKLDSVEQLNSIASGQTDSGQCSMSTSFMSQLQSPTAQMVDSFSMSRPSSLATSSYMSDLAAGAQSPTDESTSKGEDSREKFNSPSSTSSNASTSKSNLSSPTSSITSSKPSIEKLASVSHEANSTNRYSPDKLIKKISSKSRTSSSTSSSSSHSLNGSSRTIHQVLGSNTTRALSSAYNAEDLPSFKRSLTSISSSSNQAESSTASSSSSLKNYSSSKSSSPPLQKNSMSNISSLSSTTGHNHSHHSANCYCGKSKLADSKFN